MKKLMNYLKGRNCTENPAQYMSARMEFFNNHSKETHIFFEAFLSPPSHLSDKIRLILSEFNSFNESMFNQSLDSLILRDHVSKSDALSYFHLMQLMLNGYFSSPAFQNMDIPEKVKLHEMTVSRLWDYMLYGIAKGET